MASTNDLATTPAITVSPSVPVGGWDFGAWRRRRPSVIFAVSAVVAVVVLALAQQWLAVAQLTPLLFLLPCALMMFMCMKGHGRRPDSTPGAAISDRPSGTGAASG